MKSAVKVAGTLAVVFSFFLVQSVIFGKAALSLTFNDGGIHDIDYSIYESVYVYNNVNPPYEPTTVNLIVGGFIYGQLETADDSIINISGGGAESLSATDDAILNMTGGHVGSSGLYLEANSKMYFHGGGVDGFFVRDNVELVMTGGDVQTYFELEGGTAIIDGGSIYGQLSIGGDANVTISEFTVEWEFFVSGNATVTIYDGDFGETYFRGDSIVKIYGGEWRDPYAPRLSEISSVTIYGNNFNVPLGTYTADDNLDYLSGVFHNGFPFEFYTRPSPMLKDGATITLVLDAPGITSPTPGSRLDSSTVTFEWTSGADLYWLYIGSTKKAKDIYDSGNLGNSASDTVDNLPTDGSTVYVRFLYDIGTGWKYKDYTYTAYRAPEITSPTPGSRLDSSTVKFKWTSGADRYWLYIGSSKKAKDIYDSGNLGNSTSDTVGNLPTDGRKIYVRFYYKIETGWKYKDYTYTAYRAPEITSPTPGSRLDSSTVKFKWTSGADRYWLYIGSTKKAKDIYDSGNLGNSASDTVDNLPTDGSTVYVRFWYDIGSGWKYKDYTYTAYRAPEITSPTPGSRLDSSTVKFKWTSGADRYWLYIGSTKKAKDIYDSGNLGNSTSDTVGNLPTDGRKIYVRFYYKIGTGWKYKDYTYTAYKVPTTPKIKSPKPNSTLRSSTVKFKWTSGADRYWLYIGSTKKAKDIYDSGDLGNSTSDKVGNLPKNGRKIYVRFYYKIGTGWKYKDYTYTAYTKPDPP